MRAQRNNAGVTYDGVLAEEFLRLRIDAMLALDPNLVSRETNDKRESPGGRP